MNTVASTADVPAQTGGRLRGDRAQARQPDLAPDAPAGGFRQQAVQPGGDRRAGQSDPVDGAVQDPLHDRVGQGLGIGVVVDGYLVDIGQLLQLLLQEGSSSIGAGEQDPAAPGMLAEDLGERLGAIGVRAPDPLGDGTGQGPRPSPDRSPRVSDVPGPAGRGLVVRAAAGRTALHWPT